MSNQSPPLWTRLAAILEDNFGPVSPPLLVLLQVVKSAAAGAPLVKVPNTMEILAGRTRGPSAAQEYPIPREMGDLMSFSVMPTDHRNYALTWYALSAATAFLALKAARTR